MAIQARPASTRPSPTLMGRISPDPIKNRVGYGFKRKNLKRFQVGSGFWKKTRLEPDPTRLNLKENYYNTIYIYIYISLIANPKSLTLFSFL